MQGQANSLLKGKLATKFESLIAFISDGSGSRGRRSNSRENGPYVNYNSLPPAVDDQNPYQPVQVEEDMMGVEPRPRYGDEQDMGEYNPEDNRIRVANFDSNSQGIELMNGNNQEIFKESSQSVLKHTTSQLAFNLKNEGPRFSRTENSINNHLPPMRPNPESIVQDGEIYRSSDSKNDIKDVLEVIIGIVNDYGSEAREDFEKKLMNFGSQISVGELIREVEFYMEDLMNQRSFSEKGEIERMREKIKESQRFSHENNIKNKRISLKDIKASFQFTINGRRESFQTNKNIQANNIKSRLIQKPSFLQHTKKLLRVHFERHAKFTGMFIKYDKKDLLEKIEKRIESLSEVSDMFWDQEKEDRNYIKRVKLLYVPEIRLSVPVPRTNYVYFEGEYKEILPPSCFTWSKLLRPVKNFIFGSSKDDISKQQSVKQVKCEISEEEKIQIFSHFGSAGIEMILQGFEKSAINKRFEQSFQGLLDKSPSSMLKSNFKDDFILKYIMIPSLVNFDLKLHKIYLNCLDSALKLQSLTLMRSIILNSRHY